MQEIRNSRASACPCICSCCISIQIDLKFGSNGNINKITITGQNNGLVPKKPLSEPVLVNRLIFVSLGLDESIITVGVSFGFDDVKPVDDSSEWYLVAIMIFQSLSIDIVG